MYRRAAKRQPIPVNCSSPKSWVLVLTVWLLAFGSPATAQDIRSPEPSETKAPAVQEEPAGKGKDPRKADVLIAPVPFSSPSSGPGLAGGVVVFYNPNGGPQQWITGGGVIWTNRGTKGLGAYHSMSLNQDRFRFNALATYLNAIQRYFGVGEADGDRGESLELRNKTFETRLHAQIRVFPHGYGGLQYRLMTTNAEPNEDPDRTQPPPQDELNSTLSMLGPSFAYDARDSQTQPRRGVLLSTSWLFGTKVLGNSFAHNKLSLSGSAYEPLGTGTVVAANARVCATSGHVPYYDLCMFGSDNALRGYPSGRYRDRASWAVQVELRQQIIGRWGGVAFAGLGGIAPSAGDIVGKGNMLPAGGIGVRYRPFNDNDVQVRLDFGLGKDASGIYLGLGEAF